MDHDTIASLLLLAIAVLSIHVGFRIYGLCKDRRLLAKVTSPKRGEPSERALILQLLKAGLNPKAVFHDLYVRKRNGGYTQIDVVAATRCGIIVFEVKDYSGWLFGKDWQSHWTQVLAYGKEKYRFYNPIRQNEGHINALRYAMKSDKGIPFYSVIVFYGTCQLRDVTNNSSNTYLLYPNGVRRFLRQLKDAPTAAYGDVSEVLDILRQGVANGNRRDIVDAHMREVRLYRDSWQKSTAWHWD